MTTLKITFDEKKSGRFPVYKKYAGQASAQEAFISLDIETGECTAYYDGNLSGGMTMRRWNNIELTFRIRPELRAEQIVELIDENKDQFQEILDDSDIIWDGRNRVGKLGEKALSIYEQLNSFGKGFYFQKTDGGIINSEFFPEWIENDRFPEKSESLDDFAHKLFMLDGEGEFFFSDELNDVDAIKEALLETWAEYLYSGDDIPENVAKMLLESETCNDSQWIDELKEFANA